MKKFIICFFSALAIFACTNEEFPRLETQTEKNKVVVDSFYVPYETALQHALKMLDYSETTRTSAIERKVANHYEYVANKMTRTANNDIDVRFHVINFEDNQGFALVSADSRTTPVYAYSESGNLDIEGAIANCGFGDFMEAAEEYYIAETSSEGNNQLLPTDGPLPITPVPTNPIQQLPVVELDGTMYYCQGEEITIQNPGGILLNVEWGQEWPYNYFCSPNAAGCGPIAASQIMTYFKHPSSFSGYSFDWDGITSSIGFNYLSPAAESAARLIHLVGIEANASYGEETSTTISNMDNVFRTFGYSCTGPVNYDKTKVKESLDNFSPIYFRGSEPGADAGHAWVIDAYKHIRYIRTYYHMQEPYNVYTKTTSDRDLYHHCNWGWYGNYNMWCLDVFVISGVAEFSSDKRMIYNIRPNT